MKKSFFRSDMMWQWVESRWIPKSLLPNVFIKSTWRVWVALNSFACSFIWVLFVYAHCLCLQWNSIQRVFPWEIGGQCMCVVWFMYLAHFWDSNPSLAHCVFFITFDLPFSLSLSLSFSPIKIETQNNVCCIPLTSPTAYWNFKKREEQINTHTNNL